MRGEREDRGRIVEVPDVEKVVVSAGRELATVGAPAQAAHFLAVAVERAHVVVGAAHVVVDNGVVTTSAGEYACE